MPGRKNVPKWDPPEGGTPNDVRPQSCSVSHFHAGRLKAELRTGAVHGVRLKAELRTGAVHAVRLKAELRTGAVWSSAFRRFG